MARQSFVHGALVLAAAGTISRVLGLFYIVLLPRLIKDAGYGLFHMVKPAYYLAVVIAVAGLPVAISKLVAEKAAQGKVDGISRVMRLALILLLITGVLSTGALILGAPFLADRVLQDPGAVYPLLALAPSIIFLSLSSALRGFFQGMQEMGPSAASQVVEQAARVTATVAGAYLLLPRGVEFAAAGAALGSVIGGLAGLLYLLAVHARAGGPLLAGVADRAVDDESYPAILRRMVIFAAPILLGTILWPLMGTLDAAIVPARLRVAGFSTEEVRQWYGYLGMASQLMHFPTVLSMALAASLIPAVSAAAALGRISLVRSRSQEAIRVGILFGLPASVGLYLLATEVATVLFGYPQAGIPLAILAFGALSLGLYQTCAGILQGLGEVLIPLRNLVMGAVVKLGLNYVLTAIPEIGIRGAAIGTVVGFSLAAVLNLWAVIRLVGFTLDVHELVVKPFLAVAIMGVAVRWVYTTASEFSEVVLMAWLTADSLALWSGAVGTAAAVPAGAMVYGLTLAMAGGIRRRDIQVLPRIGPRLGGWLSRRGMVR